MKGLRVRDILLIVGGPVTALGAPALAQETQGCRATDLAAWSPPVAKLLHAPDVVVDRTEICDHDKRLVMHVRFKFDPRGATDDFFKPLLVDVADANRSRPFSFVDADDRVRIDVTPRHGNELDIRYEDLPE